MSTDGISRKDLIRQRRQSFLNQRAASEQTLVASAGLDYHKRSRLSSVQADLQPNGHHAQSSHVNCVLRAPQHPDELGHILGDSDPPYRGVLDGDAADRQTTTPSAEDRALFRSLHRPAGYSDPRLQDSAKPRLMTIHFGQRYTIDTCFRSVYPSEYTHGDYLCVCCYCLQYSTTDLIAERHFLKCSQRYPPGHEVYKDGKLSIWEVDGSLAATYCRNICLLAKLFLESKSLYRDVSPFYFYVLTEQTDEQGPRFVGYFSKQKVFSISRFKEPIECVSCILTMPFTQNRGYGQFLIDFSYALARRQNCIGGPEMPLSSLGERVFRSYWQRTICRIIASHMSTQTEFTLKSLSAETGMKIDHLVYTLDDLGWLHISDGRLSLDIDECELDEFTAKYEARKGPILKEENILWAPVYDDEDY